jgi:hypothetical protein
VSLIPFPNVPQVPGVPQLTRYAGGPSVAQMTSLFPGASGLLHEIDGVSAYLTTSPQATVKDLFASVPGVSSIMTSNPAFSQIMSLSNFDALGNGLSLLTGDDPGVGSLTASPEWGVFDDGGQPVAIADSFVSIEHMKDWRVANFPVAPNGFAAYNKVETPYEERITFAKGGTLQQKETFLQDIDDAVASLDLFTVVTPEVTYANANLVHYDYRRQSRQGVTLLLVEIGVMQVRVSASQTFSNTRSPAANAAQNGGTVQPQSPTTAQTNAAAAGVT